MKVRYVSLAAAGLCLTHTAGWGQSSASTRQLITELQQSNDENDRGQQANIAETGATDIAGSADFQELQIGSITVAEADGTVHPEFGNTIEKFIGVVASPADLRALATAVANDARRQGYIFATTYIPQQTVTLGNVSVVIDLGRIDRVVINGSNNARLHSLLTGLEGHYAKQSAIERKLLLARDIPGITIGETNFVREDGVGKLIVSANAQKASGWVGLDNFGDREAGPVRARLEVDYSGILDADDRVSVAATATALQPDELTFVSARYSKILDNKGTQLWVTGAAGRSHETQPGNDWRSRSKYIALGLNNPVLRSNAASLWLGVEAAFLDVDQNSTGMAALEDHVTTLTMTASGNVKLGGGRLSGGVSYTRGLDVFDATRAGDPLSSRVDGSAVFGKGNAWLNYFSPLGSGFSVRLAGNGQVASRPLLASQEIGIGGISYGRAYSFYERSGDEGAMGLFELRRAIDNPVKFMNWIQLYGYVDGGYVSNIDNGFGSGGLVSSGVGLRSGIGNAELGVEVAFPVDEIRIETSDKTPRLNLSLGYKF